MKRNRRLGGRVPFQSEEVYKQMTTAANGNLTSNKVRDRMCFGTNSNFIE
ncbi:MAG: hypothetical protein IPP86_02470 [Bacteroidetes bacterium]|nr:hypothetical protein [Bacteroidota bacterium]